MLAGYMEQDSIILVNVLFHLGFMCNTIPHPFPSHTIFSLTFSLRCSIDLMRKYTINRRTVKEVVNNNNAAKVYHFIHGASKNSKSAHTEKKHQNHKM